MISSAALARRMCAAAAVACIAAIAAGCGSTSTSTITVLTTPTSSAPGAPASSPASAPASSPAGPAECATASLRVTVRGAGAAAGTAYAKIDFTNTSSAACFVTGYPGVSLVSAGSNAGSQIGADAKRDPFVPARVITLAPGQTAHALFAVIDAFNYPTSLCQPVKAHWLKVFPPDQFIAAYIRFSTETCASTSQPTMRIQRIKAGA